MLKTNRDFYLAVLALIDEHRDTSRTLEQFIHTVLAASFSRAEYNWLTLDELFALLEAGFEREPGPDDALPLSLWDASFGFGRWFSVAAQQVRELRAMRTSRVLEDSMRYFGIHGQGERDWYNFDPLTFLECGTAGYFDGWRPGDPGGRIALPNPDSEAPPESPDPIVIEGLDWRQIGNYFIMCQSCE